jgi:hypothetical protein
MVLEQHAVSGVVPAGVATARRGRARTEKDTRRENILVICLQRLKTRVRKSCLLEAVCSLS